MKNMRLSDLRKKTNLYFKQVKLTSSSKKIIEYTVRRAFNALPSYAKEALKEDKEKYIQNIINIAILDKQKSFNPYKALKSVGNTLSGRTSQALNVYTLFRTSEPSVYAKYNSYMYRNGYSASQYFYSNAEWEGKGSNISISVKLPDKVKGIKYQYLLLQFNISDTDGNFNAELV